MTRTHYGTFQWNLSPWTRAVAGDISSLRLPHGYFVTGLAKTGAGPWTLELYGPDKYTGEATLLADHTTPVASEVRTWLQIFDDLAAIDEYSRTARVVVTADRDGWIEAIDDA